VSAGFDEDAVRRRLRHHLGLDPDSGAPVSPGAAGEASDLLKRYVGGEYTGAAFDLYRRSDPWSITSDDLVAVTMLSISINESSNSTIRPSAVLQIHAQSRRIAGLLSQLPLARDLHTLRADDFDAWLDAGSPGEPLYELLRHKISLPRVATHKLLARKRPQLFPIRDSVVENALSLSGQQDRWWRPWWAVLSSDDALVAHLHEIRQLFRHAAPESAACGRHRDLAAQQASTQLTVVLAAAERPHPLEFAAFQIPTQAADVLVGLAPFVEHLRRPLRHRRQCQHQVDDPLTHPLVVGVLADLRQQPVQMGIGGVHRVRRVHSGMVGRAADTTGRSGHRSAGDARRSPDVVARRDVQVTTPDAAHNGARLPQGGKGTQPPVSRPPSCRSPYQSALRHEGKKRRNIFAGRRTRRSPLSSAGP